MQIANSIIHSLYQEIFTWFEYKNVCFEDILYYRIHKYLLNKAVWIQLPLLRIDF